MRKLYFLVPGTSRKFGGGGLWAELKTFHLAQQICPAEIVTYRQRESNHPFLTDLLNPKDLEDSIFIISWGFDVPHLIGKLQSYNLVYHAHSTGYRFRLPSRIPIIAVSRQTMGYWGAKSPNSLIYYLPNHISDEFRCLGQPRDIDVLVQVRKSSRYLLEQLVPELRQQCRVKILDGYVEDLVGLFNRSKIYLYDSAEYWAVSGLTEGFGLPPLEALVCGCHVFSSVNSALSDYLDPGINCDKIAGYSLEYDVQRILAALNSFPSHPLPESFLEEYRSESLLPRLRIILGDINAFFDIQKAHPPNIKGLNPLRISLLRFQRTLEKIRAKLQPPR
jgi:glycosyltransferase involved in cell wall biosynthesis